MKQRTSARPIAVLLSVALLLTLLTPVGALAAVQRADLTIYAWVTGSDESNIAPAGDSEDYTYAQVAVGTGVSMTAYGENEPRNEHWAVSPEGSASDPRIEDGTWRTRPWRRPANGTITYTLTTGEGDYTDRGTFRLQVVDQVQLSDAAQTTGAPGQQINLRVEWPARTAVDAELQYRWEPLGDAPPLAATDLPLDDTNTMRIPDTAKNGDAYRYTVTPFLPGNEDTFEFQPLAITVTVRQDGGETPPGQGTPADLQGVASLDGQVYEKSIMNEVCTAKALLEKPPELMTIASGGTGGYQFAWYKADKNFTTQGEALGGGNVIANGTRATLQLAGEQLASLPSADPAAYFVCVVTTEGGAIGRATSQQNFAVTTVSQPVPVADTGGGSKDEPPTDQEIEVPPGQDLPVKKRLQLSWDPPSVPSDVSGYLWTLDEAPDGGEATVQTDEMGTQETLTIGSPIRTTKVFNYIYLIRVSRRGRYTISCQPVGGGVSSDWRVKFRIVGSSSGSILSSGLQIQSASSGVNGVLGSSAAIADNTVRMGVNGRFSLSVPTQYINNGSRPVVYQWLMRRSPTSPSESIPQNMGFYGVRAQTLVSGPLTAEMNGWQFCLQVAYADDPTLYDQTDWVTVNVSGSSATPPSVGTMTTPNADASGNIRIARGGTVTLEAFPGSTGATAQNLSYQWYTQAAGGAAQQIQGAVYATYILTGVNDAQNGQQYWCVIYYDGNPDNTQSSVRYTLSVNSSPGAVLISSPSGPQLLNLQPGQQTTLTVQASTLNGNQVSYQWYMRKSENAVTAQNAILSTYQARQFLGNAPSAPVSGANAENYTVSSLTTGVYEFFCRVTNASDASQYFDSAGYYIIALHHDTTPIVLTPAKRVTYVGGIGGDPLILPCEAYSPNNDTPTYQWQVGSSADGPWTDVGQQTSSELRLAALSTENNNQYYRCVVTNPRTEETAHSGAYMISVWSAVDTPTVTENPKDTEYLIVLGTDGTAPGYTIEITSTATLGSGISALQAQWQYRAADGDWTSVPDAAQYGTTIRGPITANGKSTLTLDANPGSRAPSGEYRCLWTYGVQHPESPLVPQSPSMPARIVIVYPGIPQIVTQPVGAVVSVGQSATYTVSAQLAHAQQSDDVLVYIWQASSDRGVTWNNCTTERDGTGQFTATFTTLPATQAMYAQLAAASPGNLQNSIFLYRCIVANRRLSDAILTVEVPLVILPGEGPSSSSSPSGPSTPKIIPGSGSTLTVTGSGTARYMRGVDATAKGVTIDTMLQELRYEPPVGYYLRIVTTTGTEVSGGAILCTGMQLELVSAATNQVVDKAEAVVTGDVLGNGKLTLSQIVRLAKAYSGKQPLDGPYKLAGMMVGTSDEISLTDLVGVATLFKNGR